MVVKVLDQFDAEIWAEHGYESANSLTALIGQYERSLTEEQFMALQKKFENIPDAILEEVSIDFDVLQKLNNVSSAERHWCILILAIARKSKKHLLNHDDFWEQDHDLYHEFMSAGESACRELIRYGFLKSGEVGGTWTPLGQKLLAGDVN